MVQTTLRLPVELYKLLKETAKRKGLSVNGFILGLLWEEVKKKP